MVQGKNQGQSGGGRKWVARSPRAVSEIVSDLLNPVIERRAGMTTDLVAAWDDIAGEMARGASRPEKLVWPKKSVDTTEFSPAMLVLACEGNKALFLQHQTTRLLERVNRYFGFTAVSSIKIVQKTLVQPRRRARPLPLVADAGAQRRVETIVGCVEDEKLRASLARLGECILAEKR
jgi:hypothetical protein